MTHSQGALLKYLNSNGAFNWEAEFHDVPVGALAELFVYSAFLGFACQFLKDEHWLKMKAGSSVDFPTFIVPFFSQELQSIDFLKDVLTSSSVADLKKYSRQAVQLEKSIMDFAVALPFAQQRDFARVALQRMAELFKFEDVLQRKRLSNGLDVGLSLYRTFDSLDRIFDLNYEGDLQGPVGDDSKERLYTGSGVGVQSGYSTVALTLENMDLPVGARFIDLGSGYGRVGFVVGLLRPDIDFLGYEYVNHRVEVASATSEKLGLSQHVHFYTQDLSLLDFQIPEAELYYLYDPFSEETYTHVLSQLIAIGRNKSICIATKGNARKWLLKIAEQEKWGSPQEFDSGNLCLFRT